MKLFTLFSTLAVLGYASAQVTLNPTFVTQNDTVEVIFDASQGNAELAGVSQVYAHTGVITSASSSATDWRYVQGTWGTADPKVQMTSLGNDKHSIKYHINTFYNVPSGETVQSLAFVFRNQDGSKVGRAAGGGDIFVPIYSSGLQAVFTNPTGFSIYDINDTLKIQAQSSVNGSLSLYHESTLLTQVSGTNGLSFEVPLVNYGTGKFDLILQAVLNGNVIYDTLSYLARSGPNIGVDTVAGEEGITAKNDSTVYLKLRAPFKSFVYVIGDFNDWEIDPAYEMFKTPDSKYFWIEISGLDAQTEYAFQYYIDSEGLRVADAYSEKILDPWNDPFIDASTYPNLKPYPDGKTNFPVGVFQLKENPYPWQHTATYQRPAPEELVIYELLIRDFDARHTYRSVIERLPYLTALGINAIELMPIMEFEGNESWGYNPMFFMAPDKYYGSKNELKALIDSCHGRGIAVIMDIALNHAFGQNPMVRMYFDPSAGPFGQPTAQNPWLNEVPKHEFNVGYDFNHESEGTKYFARRVLQHWVQEYKIDGYRMDLSKGFTQKNTLGSVAAWGQYDQSRINILSRLKDDVHQIDNGAYMILEHFADNPEEKELAARGFLLWGNENHQYNEASMGYTSNLSGVYHSARSFDEPRLVGYMESHDEERLMFRNLNFGKTTSNYSTKDLETALDRIELSAAFFYTIPGPKMLWQFGEMGYDYSINHCPDGTIDPGCRVANKPIRWDYLNQQGRADLHNVFSALIWLRRQHPGLFNYGKLQADWQTMLKTLQLTAGDSVAIVIGNFDVLPQSVSVTMPDNGWWYEYFSGDSVQVSLNTLQDNYSPGEYQLYTNFKTAKIPFSGIGRPEVEANPEQRRVELFPNPSSGEVYLKINLPQPEQVYVRLWSLSGQLIWEKNWKVAQAGVSVQSLWPASAVSALEPGSYLLQVQTASGVQSTPLILTP